MWTPTTICYGPDGSRQSLWAAVRLGQFSSLPVAPQPGQGAEAARGDPGQLAELAAETIVYIQAVEAGLDLFERQGAVDQPLLGAGDLTLQTDLQGDPIMLTPLADSQRRWVGTILAGMSLDQCLGQLLCPEDRKYSLDDWLEILRKVPVGNVFFGRKNGAELESMLRAMQAASPVPLLVAGDLEHGATPLADEGIEFPWPMAAGAAADPDLLYGMGRATALQGRHRGFHWTFAPVADLNLNFQNPVTNTRALGDCPEKVISLLKPLIRGLQEDSLLAGCAKHFPGDGVDDRDQHLCTSVNSLPVQQWWELYGKVWKAVIDQGVMSIMAGHISFPAYEGLIDNPEEAMPATLNRPLQVDLLRNELGFEGVLVSDAAPMIGICSRSTPDQQVVQNIASGSDVYLFADPVKDFERLQAAVKSGTLSEAQVRQSARRVLELKARLNLHIDPFGPRTNNQQLGQARATARTMAEKAVTALRKPQLPKLTAGDKVLAGELKAV